MTDHTTNIPSQEIPYGYCHCGCGQKTGIVKETSRKRNQIKGEPYRFMHGHGGGWERPPLAERFWSKVKKTNDNECWEWQASKTDDGHGEFWDNKSRTMKKAHRVSYELAYGPIPDGLCVCHNCPSGDNPGCVNPSHLLLGTIAYNNKDRESKGRSNPQRGEKNYRAKFTDDDIRSIRKRHAQGISLSTLAHEYNVNKSAIHKIVKRESWRHID